MKGFIEVTDKTDNSIILLPIDKIVDIMRTPDGEVFVDMVVNAKGETLGINTVETLDEIKQKIIFAR